MVLARLEPETLTAEPECVDLDEIVLEVFENLKPMADAKVLEYYYKNNAKNTKINAQNDKIFTLAEIIIQNAILYNEEKGRIDITLSSDKNEVIFSVADNGVGIPAKERVRVFDRFYRVLGTQKTGSGLGLSIAKNITEQYGGTIAIEDGINGQGCAFIVCFPTA